MTHNLRGVILTLLTVTLLGGLAGPAFAVAQDTQEDPVQRAMREYQVKVDQLERLTKRVLNERKQQLDDAEARLRKHQDEAAALTRQLRTVETRNKQLNSQVAQLRNQLRAADAERNRLRRSLAKRQPGTAQPETVETTETPATKRRQEQPRPRGPAKATNRATDAKTSDTKIPNTNIRVRLHRMEDQAAEMEQWIRRLKRDLRSVRRRREL